VAENREFKESYRTEPEVREKKIHIIFIYGYAIATKDETKLNHFLIRLQSIRQGAFWHDKLNRDDFVDTWESPTSSWRLESETGLSNQ